MTTPVQPVPPPATAGEFAVLLADQVLVDLTGRALRRRRCPVCRAHDTLGETCPQSLRCPACQAPAGRRCRRPSGHVLSHLFGGWHVQRRAAAEAVDERRQREQDSGLPAPWPRQELDVTPGDGVAGWAGER